jgi:hypothetical protein
VDNRELIEGFFVTLDEGELDEAMTYLADDFRFYSSTFPDGIDVYGWMGLLGAWRAGAPDMRFNLRLVEMEGDSARVTSRITGTHTGDLDLTPMGLGVIPPTGSAFTGGEEESEGVVENGRIKWIRVFDSPETGFASVLGQLGVRMPPS